MSVQYRLTLAGEIPVGHVAECALLDPAERPTPTESGRLLATDLHDRLGFGLSVRASRGDFYGAQDDDDSWWEWQPSEAINLTFDLSSDDTISKGIPNMLATVARVLKGRPEDAALVLNFDLLLLTRVSGVLRKHNRATWWGHYGFVNDIIPG